MYTPSQLRLLKIAVIAMGVILLLGFAAVIGRIVWLVNSAPKPSADVAAPAATTALAPQLPIALPKGAVIRHMSVSGSRLAIHYESPEGGAIRIIDLGPGGSSVTLPIVEAGR
jgi:uncharacterized membrane protein